LLFIKDTWVYFEHKRVKQCFNIPQATVSEQFLNENDKISLQKENFIKL